MVTYLGDFAEDDTVDIPFNTFTSDDPSASSTITNFINTDVHIHKDGGLTQRNNAAGITVSVDFDSITGNHLVKIDTSDDTVAAFWVTGSEYQVRVEGTTVDGATINAWIGAFSIERAGGAIALLKLIQAAVITNAAGADVAADIIAVKAETASILTDTGTTLENRLIAIEADTDVIDDATSGLVKIASDVAAVLVDTGTTLENRLIAIEADTNELQTDDYPTSIAAIKAETALIVADTNELQTDDIPATLTTIASYLDTEIAAILEDTDTTIPGLIAALNNLSAAQVNAEVDTALSDIKLDHLVAVAESDDPVDNSIIAKLAASDGDWSGFDESTDSLEAIRDRGDADWSSGAAANPNLLLEAEIAVVNTQTEFTLASGSDEDDAYNDQAIVLYDDDNSDFPSIRTVLNYVGATKTVTINEAPVFTLGADDSAKIFVTAPGSTPPTAAAIVDEWESQSQANPTGFHVNVKEVNDTPQTANDNGADINAILVDTNELQIDWVNGGRLDLLIDAIKAVTDNLPDSGALNDLAAILTDTGTTLPTTLAAINALVDDLESRLTAARAGYLDELTAANIPADIDTLLARITAAVALASVCTEARLAELDAANLPADVDAALADTNELQTDDYPTSIAAIKAETALIVADTGTDGVVVAAASKTGYTLSDAGVDAVFDRNASVGISFEVLIERIYQLIQNKETIVDATGGATLRNIGDSGDLATWIISDDDTTTTRTEAAWA